MNDIATDASRQFDQGLSDDQQIAVITGGAAGIGEAIARRLSADGFMIVIADLDGGRAEALAADISGRGGHAIGKQLDVSVPEFVAALFDWLAADLGACDVLVNNAGVASTTALADLPLERWESTIAVNVTGALLMTQRAVPLMKLRGRGRVVNISSISGVRASAGRIAYGTSKAAIIGLTRQLAIELAADNITVNSVAPGPVDTATARAVHTEATRRSYLRLIPMKRYGRPEEIAAAVSFLCSADASYITGHTVPVDGGFLAAGVLEI
jgi:NAD(P)-dependent dehydrogenase (short-subunit alcohol dehydrogenase family)